MRPRRSVQARDRAAATRSFTARVPVVDASELPRAVAACRSVVAACGLRVDDAVVLNDSNRLAVHLGPCDVLARVAPRSRLSGAEFEVELATRLAESGAPLATLDPRVGPARLRAGRLCGHIVDLLRTPAAARHGAGRVRERARSVARRHAARGCDRRLAAALHGSS